MINFTICGGGCLGHVTAGFVGSLPDVRINILTNHPEKWGNQITVYDPAGKEFVANINHISSNPAEVRTYP